MRCRSVRPTTWRSQELDESRVTPSAPVIVLGSVSKEGSVGTATFSGTDAIVQLWAFIVFPLIGAVVGALVWLLVHENQLDADGGRARRCRGQHLLAQREVVTRGASLRPAVLRRR